MSALARETVYQPDASGALAISSDALASQLRRMERLDALSNGVLAVDAILLMAALGLLQDMRYIVAADSIIWRAWINPALTIAAALLVVVCYCIAARARQDRDERQPQHPRLALVPQIVSDLRRTRPEQLRSWYDANAELATRKGRVLLLAVAALLVGVLPVGMTVLLAMYLF